MQEGEFSLVDDLDPQVKTLLESFQAMAAQQPAPDHILSTEEKIAASRQMVRDAVGLGIPSELVSRIEDLDIPGPGGKLPIRMYVPHSEDSFPESTPALIYYHGGGFVAGDLESHDRLLRALANRAQCIVISVKYRLAPEHPYPAANDDAWASLKWVADHASEIGVDPQRLVVGGDSSGGLLAAWVAQKAATNGPMLRLQILLYPNLDATTSKASWREFGSGAYLVSHAQMLERFDAYLPQNIRRDDPKISPLFATDLTGVAAALIVTADHDPLRDEGNEYADKLKAANITVEHTCWSGMVHGFASLAGVLDAGKMLIDQIGASLRKAFQQTAT
jgi:acetyl esterase